MDKVRVLVVEDNAIIRHVVRTNLRRYGLESDFAENGLRAVEQYSTNDYDLILMDVAMPIEDGVSATKRIREIEQGTGKRVPIIAITASATRADCLAAGMDDYVVKPPDYERVLRRWLPDIFPSPKQANE